MNVAITGGTGFLGQALIRLLVPQVDAIRVLVRRPQDDNYIRSLGTEPVRGDLTKPGGCDQLVRPGDIVFHSAARVEMTGRWELFKKTTVDGTRRLLASSLPCRPSRFVYVSSASVYSPAAANGKAVRADRTPTRPSPHNFYARAKLEAEALVRTHCERAGCPWSIVRLGFLYGPGDRALISNLQELLRQNWLFIIGPGNNRIATLYIDDSARAVILAGTHPNAVGRIYDVANDEPVTQREFLQTTVEILGHSLPLRHIPKNLAYVVSFLVDQITRFSLLQAAFSRAMITIISTDQVVDASRIREELCWRPEVQFNEGMLRTREWYLANRKALDTTNPSKMPQPGRESA